VSTTKRTTSNSALNLRYVATAFSTLLILVAVLLPGSQVPDVGFAGIDKLAHIALFALWAVCVRLDFTPGFRWQLWLAGGLLFSFLSEVLQIMVEARTFDWMDMVADAAGLLLGISTGGLLLKWLNRFRRT
jgi:VanZ family protein